MSNPNPAAAGIPAADPVAESRFRRQLRRAEAYVASGQPDAAIASYEAALQLQPEHVSTLLHLAGLHLAAGRHNPARALVLQALRGHLDSPRTALHLVAMLYSISESGMIVDIARQLKPPMWDSAASLAEMAQNLSLIGAHDLAREFASASLARDPNNLAALNLLATTEVFFGELTSAAERVKHCLELDPNDSGAHWLLSRLRLPEAEKRVGRVEQLLERKQALDDEARLAYALHNELHDLRDYERAWPALERACRAKRSALAYDPAASVALFDSLYAWSPAECGHGDGYVDPRLTPVFVVGMHRSGTTLAERILSGHSRVAAAGETYDIPAALRRASGYHGSGVVDRRIIEARARFDYRQIGESYLQGVRWRAAGSPYVTDKLPSNFHNIGFIARALPQARIIHMRRDPIDVGLSNLRTLFSGACPYSYSQDDFVAYYRLYERLMAHWHALLPGRILDVDYAALVNEPQATAEAMARFCGLEFEPAMVQIEKRSDAVATASSVMMRDGIRKDRGKVWKVYERQLQPMIRALATE